jgi:hypothetical protein
MVTALEADMARYFDVERDSPHAVARPRKLYRFGSAVIRHGRGRAALNRLNGYLTRLIDRIADAKMRRMLRELELRGIHYDRDSEAWDTGSHRPRIGG